MLTEDEIQAIKLKISDIERQILADPTLEYLWAEKADCFFRIGMLEEALGAINKAFEVLKGYFPDPSTVQNPYARQRSLYLSAHNEATWSSLKELAKRQINGVTACQWKAKGNSEIIDEVFVCESGGVIRTRRDLYQVFEYKNPDSKETLYMFEKVAEYI